MSPTHTSTVYRVADWSEVFETAESRKYKHLTWISERTDFNSTGWQQGLDTFGPAKWLQIYGAWMCIVRVAATAKSRGVLCGANGEPYSAARIARPGGVDPDIVAECIEWAITVRWLLPADAPGESPDTPGESPGDLPEVREKVQATERNGTTPNETRRNGTARKKTSEPSRADDEKNQGVTSGTTGNATPSRVTFRALIERCESLQQLEKHPVTPSPAGANWFGSVFGPDRLRKDMIAHAEPKEWFTWYEKQLGSPSPVLNAANVAEAAIALALVYAARRIPEQSVKSSRLAIWITSVTMRDAANATETDLKRAVQAACEFFQAPLPVTRREPQKADEPPAVVSKPKSTRSLKESLSSLRSSQQSGST